MSRTTGSTLRESRGNDIWFHTQKIPGSHVIVVTEGREVPNGTMEQAAHSGGDPQPGSGIGKGTGGLHPGALCEEAEWSQAGHGDL